MAVLRPVAALLYHDAVPDATLSVQSGSLDSSTPVTRLQDQLVSGDHAVLGDTVPVKIRATWSSSQSIDYAALVSVSADDDTANPGRAEVRWEMGSWDTGADVAAFDLGIGRGAGAGNLAGAHVVAFPPDGTSGTTLDVTWDPGAAPDDKLIGALRAGSLWQPAEGSEDRGSPVTGDRLRVWRPTWRLKIADAYELLNIVEQLRSSGSRLLAAPTPYLTGQSAYAGDVEELFLREVFYGRIASEPGMRFSGPDFREVSLEIQEERT